jgi:hypothetical protein
MNAKVFKHKGCGVCTFNIDQKVFENRAESWPNDLIDFMEISLENIDLSSLHDLLELICDKGNEKDSDWVKGRLALSIQPIEVELCNVAEDDWEEEVALRRLQVEELKHKGKLCSNEICKENELRLEHIFKGILRVLTTGYMRNNWVTFYNSEHFLPFFKLKHSSILVLPFFHYDNIILCNLLFYESSCIINVVLKVSLMSRAHELGILICHLYIGFLMVVP